MSRQVILHVGVPKTGTSSLQRAFAANADLLRSHDVFYGLPDERGAIAQHDLIRAARAKNLSGINSYFREVGDPLDSSARILISSEIMSRFQADEVLWWKECLDQRFGTPDYVIWLFVRRPSAQIPSRWHGEIRRGSVVNLPTYVFEATTSILQQNRLPFQRAFKRWSKAFSTSSVRVVPMERLVAGDGSFVEAAFRLMFGIAGVELEEGDNQNRSLPPGQAEMLRTISMQRVRTDPDQLREFIRPLVKLLRRGDNILTDCAAMFDPMIEHLTIDDHCEAFRSLERAAIEQLGDCLQTVEEGSIFGSDPPKPVPYIRDGYWLDDSIRRRLEEVYAFAVDRWAREIGDQLT